MLQNRRSHWSLGSAFSLHAVQAVMEAESWGPLHRRCGAMLECATKAFCATKGCARFGGFGVSLNSCESLMAASNVVT